MTEMTLYSQMDPAWKLKRLGESKDATIGSFGCLLTCMSMVASAYDHEVNPQEMNERMKSVGGFQGAYIIPAYMPSVTPGITFKNFEQCRDHPAPIAEIDASLLQGKPVIVEVDYSPKDGMQNHWIVLYGKQGDDYLLRDPYPFPVETKEILLTRSRYNFAGEPKNIITGVVWFDGVLKSAPPPTPVTPPPPAVDKPTFTIFTAEEDLAFRSQPFVGGDNLIRRLPLNTELGVLEPLDSGKARVGLVNEWLCVQDAQGQRGYIAAWYVSLTKQTPPPPSPPPSVTLPATPPPTSTQLFVKTTTDGLALRNQPRIGDDTLIKFLPLFANLRVLDAPSEAQPKIGKYNQWLKVEDISGSQGYVAAWYVTTSEDTALGARRQPRQPITPDPTTLIVRPTSDLLALRSQPMVGDHTLLKRLPINTDLVVIEPIADARKKLGAIGQWLKVRDIAGVEGYVAAWYVSEFQPAPKTQSL